MAFGNDATVRVKTLSSLPNRFLKIVLILLGALELIQRVMLTLVNVSNSLYYKQSLYVLV